MTNHHSERQRIFRFERLEERLVLTAVTAPAGGSFASAADALETAPAFIGAPFPVPVSSDTEFYVGTYHDINKSGGGDSLLCWAASASNIIAYTNWGYSVAARSGTGDAPLFSTDNDIFAYFVDSFTNLGGAAFAGISWFINGVYGYEWAENFAQPKKGSGGLYPGVRERDFEDRLLWDVIGAPGETMMGKMAGLMERGYGVSAGIGFYMGDAPINKFGGHAITVWGYTYNPDLAPSDPAYYTGLIVTDSDDSRTQMMTCSMEWHDEYHLYRLSGYGAGTAWLEYFVTLKPVRPLTGVTLTGYNGPYDGREHGVTISGIDLSGPDEYSIIYTANGLSSNSAPSFTRPGSNIVNVVIVKNDYEAIWSAPVEITITRNKLAAPAINSVYSAGRNSHRVAWNGVTGAEKYEIAWSADGGESWSSRITVHLEYTVKNLPYGESILHRVRALGNDTHTAASAWSDGKSLLANPSDIDGDGFIGPGDFSLLSAAWFASDGSENWDPRFDIDGDGFIGPGDFTYLSANWFKAADSEEMHYPA